MPKNGEFVEFKNYGGKIKSPEESYLNKYQKQIACSYGYKLVSANGKFSKPFKTYLSEDSLNNFY